MKFSGWKLTRTKGFRAQIGPFLCWVEMNNSKIKRKIYANIVYGNNFYVMRSVPVYSFAHGRKICETVILDILTETAGELGYNLIEKKLLEHGLPKPGRGKGLKGPKLAK